LQTIPTVCHLLINGLLAHPKHIWSYDLSHVRSRDMLGDLLLLWLHGIRSPNSLACVSCFSGSHVGLITGLTCGTFDLELWKLNVMDFVHDKQGSKAICGRFVSLLQIYWRTMVLLKASDTCCTLLLAALLSLMWILRGGDRHCIASRTLVALRIQCGLTKEG